MTFRRITLILLIGAVLWGLRIYQCRVGYTRAGLDSANTFHQDAQGIYVCSSAEGERYAHASAAGHDDYADSIIGDAVVKPHPYASLDTNAHGHTRACHDDGDGDRIAHGDRYSRASNSNRGSATSNQHTCGGSDLVAGADDCGHCACFGSASRQQLAAVGHWPGSDCGRSCAGVRASRKKVGVDDSTEGSNHTAWWSGLDRDRRGIGGDRCDEARAHEYGRATGGCTAPHSFRCDADDRRDT